MQASAQVWNLLQGILNRQRITGYYTRGLDGGEVIRGYFYAEKDTGTKTPGTRI